MTVSSWLFRCLAPAPALLVVIRSRRAGVKVGTAGCKCSGVGARSMVVPERVTAQAFSMEKEQPSSIGENQARDLMLLRFREE